MGGDLEVVRNPVIYEIGNAFVSYRWDYRLVGENNRRFTDVMRGYHKVFVLEYVAADCKVVFEGYDSIAAFPDLVLDRPVKE